MSPSTTTKAFSWTSPSTNTAGTKTAFAARIGRELRSAAIAVSLCLAFAGMQLATSSALSASETWNDLKPDVFGDRKIEVASDIVTFNAPFRPDDQMAVPVSVQAKLSDGRTIRRVVIIIDENPSPVAADFKIGGQRTSVSLAAKFRLNRGTDMRAVIEASDGQLYMASRHVKFAGGQAACSAPPNGDPAEIAANMGKMKMHNVAASNGAGAAVSNIRRKAKLEVSHPNHTGMVLDQISLLYIPLRMVTNLDVEQDGEPVFSMQGSISLAQDPSIEFDYRPNGGDKLTVHLRDSDATSWKRDFPIGPSA
ncbi:MAG: quinoprotein dehydrogenase-associated SoxYZ-like carrier [Pseudomonadota bacterium]